MRIPKSAMVCAPVFLALTMGSTECQYFTNTTVPVADTTPPAVWDEVYVNGNYPDVVTSPSQFTYHIPLGTSVIAIGAGIDGGGVSNVTMEASESWLCCSGNICSSSDALLAPTTATQDGSIGATVSDGVWTWLTVTADNAPCGPLTSFEFTWTTTAVDFHGNTTVGATQRIVYP